MVGGQQGNSDWREGLRSPPPVHSSAPPLQSDSYQEDIYPMSRARASSDPLMSGWEASTEVPLGVGFQKRMGD